MPVLWPQWENEIYTSDDIVWSESWNSYAIKEFRFSEQNRHCIWKDWGNSRMHIYVGCMRMYVAYQGEFTMKWMEFNSRLLPGTDPSPDSGWGPANVVNECHPIKDYVRNLAVPCILQLPYTRNLIEVFPNWEAIQTFTWNVLQMSYEAERNFSKLFNNKLQILRHYCKMSLEVVIREYATPPRKKRSKNTSEVCQAVNEHKYLIPFQFYICVIYRFYFKFVICKKPF